ncbi:hypothetical protein K439DRAFT_942318 [Ramaria rubella]|nr:hypothetical protein K439DRAFT_942318 [Ramaria rubella]
MSTGCFTTFLSILTIVNVARAALNFTVPPTQCANTTVQWTGGSAPYQLLLVPTGELHPEVRVIETYTIDSGNNFSFQLNYPGNSSFVAVMSDATGFGTGGTTPVTTVLPAASKSCLGTSQVAPEFFIFTDPPVPQTCSPMMISYTSDSHPPVDVFVVIPGGTSSRIESGSPKNMSFEWTPTFSAGTQLLIVAGDTNGVGKGGSTDILTVASGNSTSCLPANTTSATTMSAAPVTTHAPSAAKRRLFLSKWTVISGLLFLLVRGTIGFDIS